MLKHLERFDAGVARGEAALATLFLVSMIAAASIQAVFRNLSGMEVDWATASLESLTWVDPFLQKGTLWLAFLGASLATREGRHIGIDLFPRLAPIRVKLVMRAVAGLGSAVVSFYLARAFWAAVLVNADERPASMEVWGDQGSMHVCDATAQQVADASLEVPTIFCSLRGALAAVNVPVETGESALQLIVPVMFMMIAARLFANAIGSVIRLVTGDHGEEEPPSHEIKRKPEGASDEEKGR
ncbi:MAG: TRAP transporter small permease subunit [Sandaracinaceae bacterium]|nr:TRAP transporter small permease subunit [Sandaracinaceae bacterium]